MSDLCKTILYGIVVFLVTLVLTPILLIGLLQALTGG